MDNVKSEIGARLYEANVQMQKTLRALTAFSVMDPQMAHSMISRLTSALRQVREAGLPPGSFAKYHPASQEALYWSNLGKLEAALPALHIQLRMRRANVDLALSHRKTVTRWVESNKEIY